MKGAPGRSPRGRFPRQGLEEIKKRGWKPHDAKRALESQHSAPTINLLAINLGLTHEQTVRILKHIARNRAPRKKP